MRSTVSVWSVVSDVVILDLDGTLVDTNYQHALAWFRAFREYGCVLPVWRIHRAIGMGGDNLVEHLAGTEVERRFGDSIRAAESGLYRALIGEVEPLSGPEGCCWISSSEGASSSLQARRRRRRSIITSTFLMLGSWWMAGRPRRMSKRRNRRRTSSMPRSRKPEVAQP